MKRLAGFQNVLQGKKRPKTKGTALKYDLTIPFARYVSMNHVQLPMPFKDTRLQLSESRPTPEGRYREFVQCDADVGVAKLINELKLAGSMPLCLRNWVSVSN